MSSACMIITHKGHTDTIQVYSVTVMTHVKALQAGHSSQGTSEPITPAPDSVVTAMFLKEEYSDKISLKNQLQYIYFDNFVGFVNFIHHKPPRTASIFLTRHLGLLTRHHGRCHATPVI